MFPSIKAFPLPMAQRMWHLSRLGSSQQWDQKCQVQLKTLFPKTPKILLARRSRSPLQAKGRREQSPAPAQHQWAGELLEVEARHAGFKAANAALVGRKGQKSLLWYWSSWNSSKCGLSGHSHLRKNINWYWEKQGLAVKVSEGRLPRGFKFLNPLF